MTKVKVRALTFDVIGTLVDVYGSLKAELQAFAARFSLWPSWQDNDWDTAILTVLNAYSSPAGFNEVLDRSEDSRAVATADREYLYQAWYRLRPWPDVPDGLAQLRRLDYQVVTLSNIGADVLEGISRTGGLAWDIILSAAAIGRRKPDPEVYRWAARKLGLPPGEVMMVAAHQYDLDGAKGEGFRTAFVFRPLEYDPSSARKPDPKPDPNQVDLTVEGLGELANQLGPRS